MMKSMTDWQTESDMNTLMEAEKIKKDPKRLKAAQKLAKSRYAEMEEAGLCGDSPKQEAKETSEKGEK